MLHQFLLNKYQINLFYISSSYQEIKYNNQKNPLNYNIDIMQNHAQVNNTLLYPKNFFRLHSYVTHKYRILIKLRSSHLITQIQQQVIQKLKKIIRFKPVCIRIFIQLRNYWQKIIYLANIL
ncbi:unnamed protein product [Paramecium octaurelia]|uniref:Uncharacterized protein n=1 Tax=Paramecium octaurelia TaxID=43137 RepID=A0A8S1T339_PAROT|nr:unnamed protein product [Paramecium octaurelia]